MFLFVPEYFDLTTISPVVTLTGGQLYPFHNYNGLYDGERVHYELFRNLTRNYAYDCVMTLRTSLGI